MMKCVFYRGEIYSLFSPVELFHHKGKLRVIRTLIFNSHVLSSVNIYMHDIAHTPCFDLIGMLEITAKRRFIV